MRIWFGRFWLLLALSLMVFSPSCVAQWYEWTDENGQRHFSDRRPVHDVEYESHAAGESDLLSSYASPESVLDAAEHVLSDDGPGRGSQAKKKRRRSRGESQAAAQQARCKGYLKKMKQTQAKLRRGYTEPKGNQLRRKRSALSRLYQDECQ